MMDLPINLALAVIQEGAGEWDTRRIDLELGLRGVAIESGILGDLRALREQGLIERVPSEQSSTGPCWRITPTGEQLLAAADGITGAPGTGRIASHETAPTEGDNGSAG